VSENLAQVFESMVRRMQEPLGLDRWDVKVESGTDNGTKASCSAQPQYKIASLRVDPDEMETGDELDEIAAHELAHCHIWPIAAMADNWVVLLCELLPEPFVAPFAKQFKKITEEAEEATTTRVGHTYIRLLRRLWKAEEELKALRAEVRQLKKVA
jgi:hypothetical protein